MSQNQISPARPLEVSGPGMNEGNSQNTNHGTGLVRSTSGGPPLLTDESKPPKVSSLATNKNLTSGTILKPAGLPSAKSQLPTHPPNKSEPTKSNGVNSNLTGGKNEISKEGMVKCENCGLVGVKDAFYTKDRNFCSPDCVKGVPKKTELTQNIIARNTTSNNRLLPTLKKMEAGSDDSRSSTPTSQGSTTTLPEASRSSSAGSLMTAVNKPKKAKKSVTKQVIPVVQPVEPSFDWSGIFRNPAIHAAPVSCFKHVPVSHVWDNVTEGMKVEVRNTDVNPAQYRVAFWVASVIRIRGYTVLLRFEGFGDDSSRDFWANLCTAYVHPVGWCATKGKPLMPPNVIASKYGDWRDFLVGRLTGARTLPQNLQSKVENALRSKYEVGTRLEVVDKNRICRVRLATVKSTIGKRLNLMYFDSKEEADEIGFWCHEESPLIHLCGWAVTVGHEILAPPNYNPKLLTPASFKFKQPYEHIRLKIGLKLEVIDPLNLSAICAATVKRVLKHGYIMVRVDCYEEDPQGADWFCHHVTSPNIFPCGFASQNNILLTPPYGYEKNTFNWKRYFDETGTAPLQLYFPNQEPVEHNLKEGMKLEAADLMDPRLICVATVGRVVGSLLKIHFDGWEEEYDQWLDATSPDIYPVGYCELVKHKLEKPPQPLVAKKTTKAPKKGKKKATKRQGTPSTEASAEKKAKEFKVSNAKGGPIPASKTSYAGETPKAPSRLQKIPDNKPKGSTPGTNIPSGPPKLSSQKQPSTAEPESQIEGNPNHIEGGDNSEQLTDNETVVTGETDGSQETGAVRIPKLTNTFFNADMPGVDPDSWTIQDVGTFLQLNDCGTHCESFEHNKMDGPKLLSLTKDQIIVLTKMKVGPAVKILDLIGHLKRIANYTRTKKENKSKVPP